MESGKRQNKFLSRCCFFLSILFTSKVALAQGVIQAPRVEPLLLDVKYPEVASIRREALKGEVNQAISSLQKLSKKVRTPNEEALVNFWMGILEVEAQQYEAAIAPLQNALNELPPLSDYSRYFLLKAYNSSHQYDKAGQLLNFPPPSEGLIAQHFFWEEFNTLVGLKKYDDASNLLRIKKDWGGREKSLPAQLAFHELLLLKAQGKKDLSRQKATALLTSYAGSRFEYGLLKVLGFKENISSSFLSPLEWQIRAKNLIEAGQPQEAVWIYDNILGGAVRQKAPLAYALFKARDYARAAILYEELWKAGNKDLPTLISLATSLGRSDQFEKAIFYNQEIISRFPGTEGAKEALRKVPFLYFDSGQFAKAYELYNNLITIQKKPSAENLWKRMWCSALLKKYSQALNDLDVLGRIETAPLDRRKVLYWKARFLDKSGSPQLAKAIYLKLSQTGLDYYTRLARVRLQGRELHPLRLIDPPPMGKRIETHALPTLLREIDLREPLGRAIILSEIGLYAYAYDESERSTSLRFGLAPSSELSQLLGLASNYRRVFLWSLTSYPLAYPELVSLFTDEFNLPIGLAHAIMKQESTFHPFIVSPADALGLMQIIPSTGREIARSLGLADFHHEDLVNPEINIRFGSYYLGHLLSEFGGNLFYTIAGYNAGPDAVKRWKKKADYLEPDEFVELIPYKETNEYVKKVMGNFWTYNGI